MTIPQLDPLRDLAAVRDATDELLAGVSAMEPSAVAGASRLPGWTRGHVITHLARTADALINLLIWARTGVETPAYVDSETREKDIAEGSARELGEQVADLRASHENFLRAAGSLPEAAWAAQVSERSGRVLAAAEIPWERLVQVRLHHVDLDIGYNFDDLPEKFVSRELAVVINDLSGREGVAPVRLRLADGASMGVTQAKGWERSIGAADQPEVTVTGSAGALLAWLTGRSRGDDLEAMPSGPLPNLPPMV